MEVTNRIMESQRNNGSLIWIGIGVLALMSLMSQARLLQAKPSFDAELETMLNLGVPFSGRPVDTYEAGSAEDVKMPAVVRDSMNIPEVERATPVDLFVDAIIAIESGGNPDQVGGAGERGLMQIMRTTWIDMTVLEFGEPLTFDRAFEPDLNVDMGKAYLNYLQVFLHKHQPRWKSDRRSLLLACYNAGPGAVEEAGFDTQLLPRSTQAYIERAISLHDFFLFDQARESTVGLDVSGKSENVL